MTPDAPFHADVAEAPEGAEAYWIVAADGTRLRAVAWRGGTAGTAVIFPGRTEFAEKYGRVVRRLLHDPVRSGLLWVRRRVRLGVPPVTSMRGRPLGASHAFLNLPV